VRPCQGRAWGRWTLLGATSALLLIDLMSARTALILPAPPGTTLVGVIAGQAYLSGMPGAAPERRFRLWHRPPLAWRWWITRTQSDRSLGGWQIGVPLWMPLAPMSLLTLEAWRPRKSDAACARCQYPRVGLPANLPCPECGAPPARTDREADPGRETRPES
jgi:hypothetical protein